MVCDLDKPSQFLMFILKGDSVLNQRKMRDVADEKTRPRIRFQTDHSGGRDKSCWGDWLSTCKRTKLGASLIPNPRANAVWTKDQDIGAEP